MNFLCGYAIAIANGEGGLAPFGAVGPNLDAAFAVDGLASLYLHNGCGVALVVHQIVYGVLLGC